MSARAGHVAFSDAVRAVQAERGSRDAYARVEAHPGGGSETEVTDDLRAFLAQIDTAFLATASADGQPYVQHRGGPKGFIRALDEHTLAFADLRGNRQYISTGNLRENDRVCLFLIDYARRARVKVWGHAEIVAATHELAASLGPPPAKAKVEQVMVIHVDAWDSNCPQHIPVKLDATDVAVAIDKLQARIAELEAENAALLARVSKNRDTEPSI
jgi:predicted pyridoxine 5'-phosphate oxidase superfamily flavin-nucleotide-binding protein